jgi:hypothetical protein
VDEGKWVRVAGEVERETRRGEVGVDSGVKSIKAKRLAKGSPTLA